MKIIGCDLHTRYQQVAMLDQETGELVEGAGPPLAFHGRRYFNLRLPHLSRFSKGGICSRRHGSQTTNS
jgi:hypothetical protein